MSNEKRTPNPIPYLIAVLVIGVIALIYYNTTLLRPKPLPEPSPSAEPTTMPIIVDDKPQIVKVTTEEVEAVLKPAADLITSRYHYTNATSFDSVLTWFGSTIENPFTRSKGYITYDGVVSVGVEMDAITFEIDNDARTITFHLPRAKVLAHEIDDASVQSDSHESIFNNLDAEYYARLIDGLKKETEKKVMGNADYMKEVRKNTELVLTNFLLTDETLREFQVEFAD